MADDDATHAERWTAFYLARRAATAEKVALQLKRRGRDAGLVEEVTDDVLLDLFLRGQTKPGEDWTGRVHDLVAHHCFDHLLAARRRDRIARMVRVSPALLGRVAGSVDLAWSPDGDLIRRALAGLPAADHFALLAHDGDGIDYDTLADHAGVSAAVMRQRVHRARRRFRAAWAALEQLPGVALVRDLRARAARVRDRMAALQPWLNRADAAAAVLAVVTVAAVVPHAHPARPRASAPTDAATFAAPRSRSMPTTPTAPVARAATAPTIAGGPPIARANAAMVAAALAHDHERDAYRVGVAMQWSDGRAVAAMNEDFNDACRDRPARAPVCDAVDRAAAGVSPVRVPITPR
jgi:DNA-directed RNA polymerase specialized sigma24 family protein